MSKIKKGLVMKVSRVHQWGDLGSRNSQTEVRLESKMIKSGKLPSPGQKVWIEWEEEE